MHDFDEHPQQHSEQECSTLLDSFLLAPANFLDELAPEGWEQSPLLLAFHPTPEQQREEADRLTRNQRSLFPRAVVELPADDDAFTPVSSPIEPEAEVVRLLGLILWDVFSNNHSVVDSNGVEFHLGSFRGSAGFIAEELGRRYPDRAAHTDYLDFYMGSIWIHDRVDLRPLYRRIFGQLHRSGCSWRYSFPQIHLVSFAEPEDTSDPLAYDPSAAIESELRRAESARQSMELRERLDEMHRKAVADAQSQPPPPIVVAYRDVYGHLPDGWPPCWVNASY
ncbi:hypothetical protein BH09GEM1_BH09GEM1_22370 [soil metagenome]